jgi:hypothetical protein
LRNAETSTDLASQQIRHFSVTGNGFYSTGGRIGPKRMRASLALQDAPMESTMPKQPTPLHASGNVSHFHGDGLALGVRGYATKPILPPILED